MTSNAAQITDSRIRELRASELPYLDMAELTFGEDSERATAALTYLTENSERFADPHGGQCINCGIDLTGFLTGSFTWSIIHGEGRCSHCGWPARAYHYFEVDGKRQRFDVILQYHPSQLLLTDERKQ